jgi:tetrahydromethanopterin S-methyltransferase subunit G
MRRSISIIAGIAVGIVVICVGLILVEIYPYRPSGVLGWVLLILIAVPVVLGLEFIGEKLLQNRIVTKMGRTARILYGVIAISMILMIVALILNWIVPQLSTW